MMQQIGSLALFSLLLCGSAAAFMSPLISTFPSPLQSRTSVLRAGPNLRPATSLTMMAEVDEKELVKVFGRIAEKTLFGDGSAGACCHSGCDNCEWRYSFDVLQSNKFEDGREHIAKWSSLFGDGEAKLSKEEFASALTGLKFDMPLGPPGYLTAKQADLSEEAVSLVWEKLSRGKATVTMKQLSMRLRKMVSPGEDGVMWSDFLFSMLEEEEDALGDIEEAIVVN